MRIVCSDKLYFHGAPEEVANRLHNLFRIRNPAYLSIERFSPHGTKYTKVPQWLYAGEYDGTCLSLPRCVAIPDTALLPKHRPLLETEIEDERVRVPVAMPPLRLTLNTIQQEIEVLFRKSIAQEVPPGHLIVVGTSGGKTIAMLNLAQIAGQKTLILVHRNLIKETAWMADISKAFGDIGVGLVQGATRRIGPCFTIAMCQSLHRWPEEKRREFLRQFGTLVLDECFVAGSPVRMANGDTLPIEYVRVGDAVRNAVGVGLVTDTMQKTTKEIVHVRFADRTCVDVTPDHPFLAARGWCAAGKLEKGSLVCSDETLSRVRRLVQPVALQPGTLLGAETQRVEEAALLWHIVCQETTQPDALSSVPQEDVRDSSPDWTQAAQQGRKRTRTDDSAATAVHGAGTRLGDGARDSYGWRAAPLQCGHSTPSQTSGGGGRRQIPSGASCTRERREEGLLATFKRVDSVSRIKLTRPVAVYNLEVSGHPSYVVAGAVVHNCHICPQPYVRTIVDCCPSMFRIMGTATPELSQFKHKFLYWSAGMPMYVNKSTESDNQLPIAEVRIEFTKFKFTVPDDRPLVVEEVMRALSDDTARNQQIVGCVEKDLADGHRVLLVTSRVEHALVLNSLLSKHKAAVLVGNRLFGSKAFDSGVASSAAGTQRLVIATNQLVQEGTSLPPLDRLHVAMPIANKQTVTQLVGRIRRKSPLTGKTDARVTIYFDANVSTLSKRVRYAMIPVLRALGAPNLKDIFFL